MLQLVSCLALLHRLDRSQAEHFRERRRYTSKDITPGAVEPSAARPDGIVEACPLPWHELVAAAADAAEEVSELQCQPNEVGISRAGALAVGTREDASTLSAMMASHQPNPHVEMRPLRSAS